MVASLRLRQLWNRIDAFPDKTEAELDRIVHVIGKELDAIEYGRQLGANETGRRLASWPIGGEPRKL